MNIRTLIIPATVAAALAIPGVASANLNTVDATCAGLTFAMARGEEGTTVTTTLDGRTVRTDTIATFGASLAYSLPSPDQTTAHTWVVVVDSLYNDDQTISRTVAACVAPSSTTPPTTAPAVVVVTTTAGVDVGPPPTPPVVTSPPTVVTMPGRPTTLPETGSSWSIALAALAATGIGAMFARLARRGV